jgi:hypothetical protein
MLIIFMKKAKKSKKASITKKEDAVLDRMTREIETKSLYCPNCGSELKEKYCLGCKKKS